MVANLTRDLMFRPDNTDGYYGAELVALNAELAERISDIDPNDDEAISEAAKRFADEVAQRPFCLPGN